MLSVRNISVRFGGLSAVSAVSFDVCEREILAIIGPNGAGKTTVFNVLTGFIPPTEGAVHIGGRDLKDPLTIRSVLIWTAIGITTALTALLIFHLQTLWNDAIVTLYIYQQPFPWRDSLRAFVRALAPTTSGDVAASLLGFLIGFGSAATSWSRQRYSAERSSALGVARTFQNIRLFATLTAAENIQIALEQRGAFTAEKVTELLELVGLEHHRNSPSGCLPYGFQRRLEIARALACAPRILLLDEPAAGLNPKESVELMELVRKIRDTGLTVILIEHDMKLVMAVSDRVMVLDHGELIASGTPAEVRQNSDVIRAYLGETR